MAAYKNYSDVVTAALAREIDVNHQDYNGFTAAMHAAKNGKLGILKQLVEAGADLNLMPDGSGVTVLKLARGFKRIEIVNYLVSKNAR